ncbi:MAG: hypothetical protein CSA68_00920 [Rhodobacterales bacterium]|nr:MAG: hypothetical protein CSA68_00920 [Rhodobacterales bacterium]
MQQPVAAYLEGGKRLHLQHGPIDLIIGAEAADDVARHAAYTAAVERFETILTGLVAELPVLRAQLTPGAVRPSDPVGVRMVEAATRHCQDRFVTPMIAVAGSVADEILVTMIGAAELQRCYVNNGGDIALFLAPGAHFSVAMADAGGLDLGRVKIHPEHQIGGIATSGQKGRSLSFGIADSVTVLGANAAQADVAATLIANAVNLPGHPDLRYERASDIVYDSDLGDRHVVVHVPALTQGQKGAALARGKKAALGMLERHLIKGAALFLQGESVLIGQENLEFTKQMEMQNA